MGIPQILHALLILKGGALGIARGAWYGFPRGTLSGFFWMFLDGLAGLLIGLLLGIVIEFAAEMLFANWYWTVGRGQDQAERRELYFARLAAARDESPKPEPELESKPEAE